MDQGIRGSSCSQAFGRVDVGLRRDRCGGPGVECLLGVWILTKPARDGIASKVPRAAMLMRPMVSPRVRQPTVIRARTPHDAGQRQISGRQALARFSSVTAGSASSARRVPRQVTNDAQRCEHRPHVGQADDAAAAAAQEQDGVKGSAEEDADGRLTLKRPRFSAVPMRVAALV